LLAVIGQSACLSGRGVSPSKPAGSERKFRDDRPPLPEGVTCFVHPMVHYWHVSSRYRDPKHVFTPGYHAGTDFPAPVGTAVLAIADGEVSKIVPVAPGDQEAYVAVRADAHWTYSVHHLSGIEVTEGQEVKRGDVLGRSGAKVGAPGAGKWTTGPHLHLNLSYDDAFVDSELYFCP